MPDQGELQELSIDTELQLKTTKECLKNKMEDVQCVTNYQKRMSVLTGEKNSVLTTATKQEKSEGFCATTAISQLDTEKQKKSCSEPLSTYEIVLDEIESIKKLGKEEVFDIQVDKTENFIANGLVVHNTRWNKNDLA